MGEKRRLTRRLLGEVGMGFDHAGTEDFDSPHQHWLFSEGFPSPPAFPSRFLAAADMDNYDSHKDSLRRTTTTDTSTSSGTNATLCAGAVDWTNEALWPPNSKIGAVPECFWPILTQSQLEQLGFFDLKHDTSSTIDAAAATTAVADFAKSVASLIPNSKKIVSFDVQSISRVNLFQAGGKSGVTTSYLPEKRYLPTSKEAYTSPAALNIDLAMFVMPRRVLFFFNTVENI